jgi:hypothetical protein
MVEQAETAELTPGAKNHACVPATAVAGAGDPPKKSFIVG